MRKLALAVAEAHKQGVVHRDLKPANILVNRRRELVILDFGLALRGGEPGDDRLTRSGVLLGTPHCMAPEQVAGDPSAIGPACDLYALGVILYELLTGRRPFEGPTALVLGLIAISEPPPPTAHRPDLDPALEAVCLKAMARRPADRHASADELARALGDYLASPRASRPHAPPEESTRPAPSPAEPHANEADAPASQASDGPLINTELAPLAVYPGPGRRRRRRRRRRRGLELGIAGALVASAVALVVTRRDGARAVVEAPRGAPTVEPAAPGPFPEVAPRSLAVADREAVPPPPRGPEPSEPPAKPEPPPHAKKLAKAIEVGSTPGPQPKLVEEAPEETPPTKAIEPPASRPAPREPDRFVLRITTRTGPFKRAKANATAIFVTVNEDPTLERKLSKQGAPFASGVVETFEVPFDLPPARVRVVTLRVKGNDAWYCQQVRFQFVVDGREGLAWEGGDQWYSQGLPANPALRGKTLEYRSFPVPQALQKPASKRRGAR